MTTNNLQTPPQPNDPLYQITEALLHHLEQHYPTHNHTTQNLAAPGYAITTTCPNHHTLYHLKTTTNNLLLQHTNQPHNLHHKPNCQKDMLLQIHSIPHENPQSTTTILNEIEKITKHHTLWTTTQKPKEQ